MSWLCIPVSVHKFQKVRSSNCRMYYILFYWSLPSFFPNVRRLFEMIFSRIVSWWFRVAWFLFWNLQSSVFANELFAKFSDFPSFFLVFVVFDTDCWVSWLAHRCWPKNLKTECKQMSAVVSLLWTKSGVLKLRWFPPSLLEINFFWRF